MPVGQRRLYCFAFFVTRGLRSARLAGCARLGDAVDLQALQDSGIADLLQAVLDPQPRLDLVLDDADHHLWPRPFLALPFRRKSVGLGGPIAAFAAVAREVLANGRLAGPDGLRNLDLVLSGLPHVGNNDSITRAEAVVFVSHSQFVVKPD
jgi:hypothetical protein